MSRPRSTQPAYLFHISGQGRVVLAGQDFYLGKHGTPESYARYYALLAEYNANGKTAPADPRKQAATERLADTAILVKHITADFCARVLPGYGENQEIANRYRNLCQLIDQEAGEMPADQFGPRKLEAIRDIFLKQGIGSRGRPNCRRQANELTRNVITIVEHGVSRELVGPDRIVALRALAPIKRGHGRDNPKRTGVALGTVKATLPHLTPTASAMVRLQFATAMRPSEMFRMTPAMIDRSGAVWFYRPDHHKTEHHGKAKAVPILGDALEALAPYLFGGADELCFITSKGTPWNKNSFRIAVTRAAKAAKVNHWTPYELRHTALQAVRDASGPEAAQALAGHSRLSTTEIYAQANEAKAIQGAQAMPKIG